MAPAMANDAPAGRSWPRSTQDRSGVCLL